LPSGSSNTNQAALSGSPKLIVPANGTRQTVSFRVASGAGTAWIGGPNVNTTNGFPISSTDLQPFTTTSTDAFYGVGTGITVAYSEVNQD
jgi:hypothetical protein